MKLKRKRIQNATILLIFTTINIISSLAIADQTIIATHLNSGEETTLDVLKAGNQVTVVSLNGEYNVAGHDILFDQFSGIFGQSSDAAYILVTSGRVQAEYKNAQAGEIVILTPYAQNIVVSHFAANKYLASWSDQAITTNTELYQKLQNISNSQKWGLFFGRYEVTNFNIAAPGSGTQELARRSIVAADAVQKIRFSNLTDPVEIEREVVNKFIESLKKGDAETAASLMDPTPFGISDLRGGADGARLLMAKKILASNEWSTILKDAELSPITGSNIWQFKSDKSTLNMALKPIGDFTFIQSIDWGE